MILVTGGAGFIGANFILDWLQQTDEFVVNLDKLTYAGNLENLAALRADPRHIFVRGDIGDAELVGRLLAEHRPRAVVNFAAESHVDRSIAGADDFIQTNVVGTLGLPTRLSQVGVPEASIPILAEAAMGDGCTLVNPREPTVEEMGELYRRAL